MTARHGRWLDPAVEHSLFQNAAVKLRRSQNSSTTARTIHAALPWYRMATVLEIPCDTLFLIFSETLRCSNIWRVTSSDASSPRYGMCGGTYISVQQAVDCALGAAARTFQPRKQMERTFREKDR